MNAIQLQTTPAVETHGLTKRFGTNVAVDEVELLVPRGSAFGYLGPIPLLTRPDRRARPLRVADQSSSP